MIFLIQSLPGGSSDANNLSFYAAGAYIEIVDRRQWLPILVNNNSTPGLVEEGWTKKYAWAKH